MSYKPNFCCQCGDTINRIDWKLTTSRRFCDLCETDFKMQDWFPHGVLAFGILMSIFGFGTFFLKSVDSQKPLAQIAETSRDSRNKPSAKIAEPQNSANRNVNEGKLIETNDANIETQSLKTSLETNSLKIKQSQVSEVQNEPVYFCGAQTKKGSPCSRKVKGGGRCWQHSGQAAMLPENKLLVSR